MSLRFPFTMLVVLGAIGANLGCQSLEKAKPSAIAEKLDIPNGVPWKSDKKAKPGSPTRIVATWSNTVLQKPGEGSERGFGGRLFFYGAKDHKPIMVDGQLVVYAFDETGRKSTDNVPTKRYVFPPEQFAKHYSESDFGASYSVWLPWGEAGGPPTDVSLIARFEPFQGGAMLVSEQSTSRLPGVGAPMGGVGDVQIASKQLKPNVAENRGEQVQQASHSVVHEPTAENSNAERIITSGSQPQKRMETTSIKLPRRGRLGYQQPRVVAPSVGGAWKTEVSLGAPAVQAP